MFRSLGHPQGAALFLSKVTSKTFIKFLYINRVFVAACHVLMLPVCWGGEYSPPQHRTCCNNTLLI